MPCVAASLLNLLENLELEMETLRKDDYKWCLQFVMSHYCLYFVEDVPVDYV